MSKQINTIEEYKWVNDSYIVTTCGRIFNGKKELKQIGSYRRVGLYGKGVKNKKCLTHRIVALAFIPNPDNKLEVNHIDENKENNSVPNLNWMTKKENCNHGTRNIRQSEKTRVVVYQYDLNGNFIREWESARIASKDLGINRQSINKACLGQYKTSGKFIWKYTKEGE